LERPEKPLYLIVLSAFAGQKDKSKLRNRQRLGIETLQQV